MTASITFPRNHDLSGIRLEQNLGGTVCSPWFSYDWREDVTDDIAYYGRRYQQIKDASVSAFASLLGISTMDVMVSEKIDQADPRMDRWWQLTTRHRCKLTETKKTKTVLPENRGVIEI